MACRLRAIVSMTAGGPESARAGLAQAERDAQRAAMERDNQERGERREAGDVPPFVGVLVLAGGEPSC